MISGYSIRFDTNITKSSVIKFMTDGLLLRELLVDPLLSKYSYLILDEIHDRSLNSDILLPIVEHILKQNSNLTLVLMSATIDLQKYQQHLQIDEQNIFVIEGRSYDIDIYYLKQPIDDYVTGSVDCILQIQMQNMFNKGDVMVFMAGQEDIEEAESMLNERIKLIQSYDRQQLLMIAGLND